MEDQSGLCLIHLLSRSENSWEVVGFGGRGSWDLWMASAVNCRCSLICCLGSMRAKPICLLALCLFRALLAGFHSWLGRGGRILELHTPVQMKFWGLVIVWLSPNTLCFIPAQGSGPFPGHLSLSWELCGLAYSFQAAHERPVLIKKTDSWLSQHILEMTQKHLSHPDNSEAPVTDFIVPRINIQFCLTLKNLHISVPDTLSDGTLSYLWSVVHAVEQMIHLSL